MKLRKQANSLKLGMSQKSVGLDIDGTPEAAPQGLLPIPS